MRKFRVPIENEGGFFHSYDIWKATDQELREDEISFGTFVFTNGKLTLFQAAGVDLPKKVKIISSAKMDTEKEDHI